MSKLTEFVVIIAIVSMLLSGCPQSAGQEKEPEHTHTWDWQLTTAPTCTEAGVETQICTKDSSHKGATRTVTALGHDLVYGGTAPTCEEDGLGTEDCQRPGCGYHNEGVLAALGHYWNDGTVTTEPTCEGTGLKTFVCNHDIGHTKTETIAQLGHDWTGEWASIVEPTCTTSGTETLTCKRDHTTLLDTRTVGALGHKDEGNQNCPHIHCDDNGHEHGGDDHDGWHNPPHTKLCNSFLSLGSINGCFEKVGNGVTDVGVASSTNCVLHGEPATIRNLHLMQVQHAYYEELWNSWRSRDDAHHHTNPPWLASDIDSAGYGMFFDPAEFPFIDDGSGVQKYPCFTDADRAKALIAANNELARISLEEHTH